MAILAAVTRHPGRPAPDRGASPAPGFSRRRFLELTDRLIADGERVVEDPDWNLFRLWILNSDELLERVWGRMDRYHLAWLNVGRDSAPPGSALDEAGTRRFVAEVASAKLAVLRTMRASVARRGWPGLRDEDEPAIDQSRDRGP